MATFEELAKEHQLTISSEFIPFIESRNKDEELKNGLPQGGAFNWTVKLLKDGKEFIEVDYSCGLSHQTGVNLSPYGLMTISERNVLKCVINEGESQLDGLHCKAKKPDIKDIIYSLISDSMSIDETFEDWCANYCYDDDSIKALNMYNACNSQSEELIEGLGSELIEQLQESLQDY